MAKDLVRTRRYVKKFILMKANLQAVSLKIQVGMAFSIILYIDVYYSTLPFYSNIVDSST